MQRKTKKNDFQKKQSDNAFNSRMAAFRVLVNCTSSTALLSPRVAISAFFAAILAFKGAMAMLA